MLLCFSSSRFLYSCETLWGKIGGSQNLFMLRHALVHIQCELWPVCVYVEFELDKWQSVCRLGDFGLRAIARNNVYSCKDKGTLGRRFHQN